LRFPVKKVAWRTKKFEPRASWPSSAPGRGLRVGIHYLPLLYVVGLSVRVSERSAMACRPLQRLSSSLGQGISALWRGSSLGMGVHRGAATLSAEVREALQGSTLHRIQRPCTVHRWPLLGIHPKHWSMCADLAHPNDCMLSLWWRGSVVRTFSPVPYMQPNLRTATT
jgi:hypothetical protein